MDKDNIKVINIGFTPEQAKLPRKLKKKHKKERVYDFDIIRHNVPVKKVEFDLKLNML